MIGQDESSLPHDGYLGRLSYQYCVFEDKNIYQYHKYFIFLRANEEIRALKWLGKASKGIQRLARPCIVAPLDFQRPSKALQSLGRPWNFYDSL
jgi:hypothetical protein